MQIASNPIECCKLGSGQGQFLASAVYVTLGGVAWARYPARMCDPQGSAVAQDDQRGQRQSTFQGFSLLLFTCGGFTVKNNDG